MKTSEAMYKPQITNIGGHNLIGGLSRIYHCNYYNAYLQMTVLLTRGMANHNPERLLTDSVTPLIRLLKEYGYTNNELLDEFSYCGFGKIQQLDENTWETPNSHYGEAVCVHGEKEKSCYFSSGFLQGILDKSVTETACKIEGANADKFAVLDEPVVVENYLIHDFELETNIPDRFAFDGCQAFNTRVDEEQIIAAIKIMPLYGEKETGLFKAFDMSLTNNFADYYNRISYETYFALREVGVPEAESKEPFVHAGHVCAIHTLGRIMSSPEWYKMVAPSCETKEDWFHGMIAIINAFGWGVYRVEKLEPEDEIIVRVYNSYEGIGFRRMYSKIENDKNVSFLVMGGMLGLVHLLWKIDIRDKPELTRDFYVNQFNDLTEIYNIEQTHAIAAGDEYDRIIMSK